MKPNAQKSKERICSIVGWRITYQKDNDPKHTVKTTQVVFEWSKTKNLNVFEWTSQSTGLNLFENMWEDLKIAVHQWSLFNQTELENFTKKNWEKYKDSGVHPKVVLPGIDQERCILI